MERIYLDTSIFGGYFETEFELWTKVLFNKIQQGSYSVLYSQLTDIELTPAPEHVKQLALTIPEQFIQFIRINEEATQLADRYIAEKVVGKSSRADCIHIALATIYNADMLISWNFKHIVNINLIRGYNSVNYRLGYKMLEIRTPREILEL
jgi:hypothetical protein